jgi:hypothetical protein
MDPNPAKWLHHEPAKPDESKARKNREVKNGVQPRTRIGQERRSVALHLQCSARGELRVLPVAGKKQKKQSVRGKFAMQHWLL